jgi:biopolymer transport protein ExbD
MNVASPIPHKKARIEIIPLIDIMFFLLASFMMVSLSQVHMKGMKVNLPTGQSGETQSKKDYISVSVDKDGHAFFDKKEMSYDDLINQLKKEYQVNPDAKVFVRGDAETVHGNIIRVLDILRAAGFYKVAFEIKSQAAQAVPGNTSSGSH